MIADNGLSTRSSPVPNIPRSGASVAVMRVETAIKNNHEPRKIYSGTTDATKRQDGGAGDCPWHHGFGFRVARGIPAASERHRHHGR
jgi:hypothetical protein